MQQKRDGEMDAIAKAKKRVQDIDRIIEGLSRKQKAARLEYEQWDELEDNLADKLLPNTPSSVWRQASLSARRPEAREFLALMAIQRESDEVAGISKISIPPGLEQEHPPSASRSSRPASPVRPSSSSAGSSRGAYVD